MTVTKEEAPANSVPAVAVRRREQALLGITGRKGCVGGFLSKMLKIPNLIWKVHFILKSLSVGEETGIPQVEVKFVDMRKNTKGEGKFLEHN